MNNIVRLDIPCNAPLHHLLPIFPLLWGEQHIKQASMLVLQLAPTYDLCSLKNIFLDFIQLDFFSDQRHGIIFLLISDGQECLVNSLKSLAVYHSKPNLKQLHSRLCYFSQNFKVRFSCTIFPSISISSFSSFYLPLPFTTCDNSGSKDYCMRFHKSSQYKPMHFASDLLLQPKRTFPDAQ